VTVDEDIDQDPAKDVGMGRPVTRGRRPGARTLALAALAIAAVACLVLVALTVPRLSAASDREQRRAEVLRAARQQAVNFTTLDHRRLDRDLGRVLDGATGEFREQFEAGTKDLSELVTANQAVAEGEVLEAGIVSDDADSARVLVVADSTVTNSTGPDPQKRHYRLQLDLVRDGDRWLVSDLQFVG
jgi:Mce-associated membrane protein